MPTERQIAFDALRQVTGNDAYSNLVVPSVLRQHNTDARDSAFITELVLGTLRRRGTYDAVIGALSSRGIDALEPGVLDILRMGMHQLLTMRVPTHAAVATYVDLVRSRIGHKPAGLVNAILRRASQRSRDAWVSHLTAKMDWLHATEIEYSHPAWIITKLGQAL